MDFINMDLIKNGINFIGKRRRMYFIYKNSMLCERTSAAPRARRGSFPRGGGKLEPAAPAGGIWAHSPRREEFAPAEGGELEEHTIVHTLLKYLLDIFLLTRRDVFPN